MDASFFRFSVGSFSCIALRDDDTDDYNVLLVTVEG